MTLTQQLEHQFPWRNKINLSTPIPARRAIERFYELALAASRAGKDDVAFELARHASRVPLLTAENVGLALDITGHSEAEILAELAALAAPTAESPCTASA